MQISGIRKDIQELKRVAALENKQSKNDWLKNLTDDELQEELKKELAKLGFHSKEELHEAAKKYFAENGLKTTFDNDYQFEKYVFEHLEGIVLKENAGEADQ